ncbi:unnamed protein product [Prorocentrum cordatum]|uniref:Uncharacterized protein n=1 Tax=Prorocentrum cordatum TaxID=2364126 RepID=A0ABN9YHL7_9DINO|nr:unnamed protein product [Polarella glacialis]
MARGGRGRALLRMGLLQPSGQSQKPQVVQASARRGRTPLVHPELKPSRPPNSPGVAAHGAASALGPKPEAPARSGPRLADGGGRTPLSEGGERKPSRPPNSRRGTTLGPGADEHPSGARGPPQAKTHGAPRAREHPTSTESTRVPSPSRPRSDASVRLYKRTPNNKARHTEEEEEEEKKEKEEEEEEEEEEQPSLRSARLSWIGARLPPPGAPGGGAGEAPPAGGARAPSLELGAGLRELMLIRRRARGGNLGFL